MTVSVRGVAEDYPQYGAYLAGSPTALLGTPRSDVDVFLVGDDGGPEQVQVVREGRRFDLRFRSYDQLRRAIDDFSVFRVHERDLEQLNLATLVRLDQVVRFFYGRLVQDPGGRLGALHDRVRAAAPHLAKIVATRHAFECLNLAEDLTGAIQTGDRGAADYVSRELLFRSADALLASLDDLYIGGKWLWRRWERTAAGRVSPVFTELLTGRSGAPAVVPDLGEQLALYRHAAQDLLVMAATGVLYEPPPLGGEADGVLRRDPDRIPLPAVDGVILCREAKTSVSCSVPGALLWALSHGCPKEAAIERLRRVAFADGEGPDQREIAAYYDELVEAAALV